MIRVERKMDKSKVLVILGPSDYLQEELLQEEQIQYVYAYLKAQTFGGKLFRRGCLLLGMQNYMFSHNTRGIDLSKFDLILIDEMIYPEYVIDFIRQHNSHCKIVYWLWNTVKFGGQWRGYDKWGQWYKLLNLREKYKFQITSFDKGDCNKYDLLENGQVATRFKDLGNKPKEILFDIFFCGQDKGRLSLLIQLAKYFDGVGITYKFWIVPDDHKQYSAEEKLYLSLIHI